MVQSASFPRFPSRPFPAKEWLENKRGQAATSSAAPPSPALSGKTLDLALLLSCLPEQHASWLLMALSPLMAAMPPLDPKRGLSNAPRAGVLPLIFRRGRLAALRARLVAELAFGLSIVATPLWRLNRPRRSLALMTRAGGIGQLMEALRSCPGADAPAQELGRALAHRHLRRRM